MNRFIYGFSAAILIISLIGCAGLTGKNSGIFGKTSQKQATQNERVANLEKAEAKNDVARLTHIGAWSEGTKYALDKVEEPTKEVVVAKDINERIQALANKPDFKEVTEVKAIIDKLLSEMSNQRKEGEKELSAKDEQIYQLNTELQTIGAAKDTEIQKALKLAQDSAAKADQYKETLNDMDSFFGFGAIWYGLKKLITKMAWILGIGAVVFLVLRVLSMTNPVASGIFSIFNMIGSWFVHTISMLFPKALELAGNVSTKLFTSYKGTLLKVVDAIETIKDRQTAAKAAGATSTLNVADVLSELEKTMNTDDKDRIQEVKKELGWK